MIKTLTPAPLPSQKPLRERGSLVKTLHDCLEQEGLDNIVKKAQFLNRFDRCWQSLLPPHLQQRSHIANFAKGVLSIAVDSAQWVVELRYNRETLLQQLQATPFGTDLHQLRIYVNPPVVTPLPTYHYKPTLSPASAQLINETAAIITHINLKKALLRLAKRCK
jgi:hypothetical protein